jgi:hypothetical protein
MVYLCYVLSGLGLVSYLTALFFRGESLEFSLAHNRQGSMLIAAMILLVNLSLELHISNKT